MCVGVLSAYVSLCEYSVNGDQKRTLDFLELEFRWLRAAMLVLGIKPGSSGRAVNALNH